MANAVVKDALGSAGGASVAGVAVVDAAGGAAEGRGVCGDEGDEEDEEEAVRCNGCFVVHLNIRMYLHDQEEKGTYLAQLPDSLPLPAPIHGCPTPNFFPLHSVSKGSLTPK